jgi:hypothetical protein
VKSKYFGNPKGEVSPSAAMLWFRLRSTAAFTPTLSTGASPRNAPKFLEVWKYFGDNGDFSLLKTKKN